MKLKSCLYPAAHGNRTSIGLLLVRVIVGLAFVLHGYGKIQAPFSWMGPDAPVPGIFQFLAAFSEFGGGIALIIGLVTPLAALGIFFTMAVAVNMHMNVMHDPFVASAKGQGSYELALVYLGIALLLTLVGAGKFSLDRLIFGK